ncbi:hypothetical protein NDU88_004846 [Pleurodeles waltl]|uniref:Uncharacterized protein n=1 Tax=Pleurodeles waltl TaxID=8319 RepID=A0AAV7UI62_PLEWA|nr:hypothetical protein NDU88_004846 [Pleurodeles waltl]
MPCHLPGFLHVPQARGPEWIIRQTPSQGQAGTAPHHCCVSVAAWSGFCFRLPLAALPSQGWGGRTETPWLPARSPFRATEAQERPTWRPPSKGQAGPQQECSSCLSVYVGRLFSTLRSPLLRPQPPGPTGGRSVK